MKKNDDVRGEEFADAAMRATGRGPLSADELAIERERKVDVSQCQLPPAGWLCTRGRGHEGPCAAHMAVNYHEIIDLRSAIDHIGVVVTSSHLPGWKHNREIWQKVLTFLDQAMRDRTHGASVPSDLKVLWGVVANAGRLSDRRTARWSHVSDATGNGSTVSSELCKRFGFDPDKEVGGEAQDSVTLTDLIAELRSREALGRKKYGTDVDRTDLTNGQWRQHLREELMDALLYCLAEERTS